MPYTEKQDRAFRAAEHDPAIARRMGMTHEDATKLAHESEKLKKEGKVKPAVKSGFVDLSPVFGA